MITRKIPLRTCVACLANRPKRELVRVVRKADGTLVVDRRGKVSGRGAYLCPDPQCIDKALKTHRLERALQVSVPEDIIHQLQNLDEVTS